MMKSKLDLRKYKNIGMPYGNKRKIERKGNVRHGGSLREGVEGTKKMEVNAWSRHLEGFLMTSKLC